MVFNFNPKHWIPKHPYKLPDIPGEEQIKKAVEKEIFGEITQPYQMLKTYVTQTEALGTALENNTFDKLKAAGDGALSAARGALQTITDNSDRIGQRIADATEKNITKISDMEKKLSSLPSLAPASVAAIGQALQTDASRLDSGHLAKLYTLISDTGSGNYSAELKQKLSDISTTAAAVSSQLHIPVSNLETTLIERISDVLSELPEEAAHIIAGIVKLEELDKALKLLKQVQNDNGVVNVERKALILTSASLYAISTLLNATAKILPVTIGAEGETGVGADEKGGLGAAAGVRGGGEVNIGEEGNTGGGTTLVSLGRLVCNGLSVLTDGIAVMLEQLQLHIPTRQGA